MKLSEILPSSYFSKNYLSVPTALCGPYTAFFTRLYIFISITTLLLQEFSVFISAQAFVLHHEQFVKTSEDLTKSAFLYDVPTSDSSGNNWQLAQLKFITPFRHKRDLIERNFHIVEIHTPETNKTLTIHLSKKETLVSPYLRVLVRDGDKNVEEVQSESDSVFSGVVTMTSDNEASKHSSGAAALSVCQQHSGFCGLIVTDKEHLLIQPHPAAISTSSSDTMETVRAQEQSAHVILRINETFRNSQCANSDEIRVPLEKLKAAAVAESEAHHHSQLSSKDSSVPTSQNNERFRMTSSLLRPLQPNTQPRNDDTLTPAYPYRSSPSLLHSDKKTEKKVVEIAVFTDEDLFQQMKKKWAKDTTKKLKDYVITMINTMDLLYQHETLNADLEFSLVHLEIMKTRPRKLNKNGGRAMAYLSSFCDYAGEKNVNSEMWDHALMLTGMDLKEDASSSTAGLAWSGTMCYRYYSCSISEGTSFGAAYIITHEIGHSLGMEHDGYGISKSCDKDKYLMSPTTGPGKVEWSGCSKQNLKDFLQYGTSELRNTKSAHKPLCLSQSAVRKSEGTVIGHTDELLPGQKYNASQQCVLAMGPSFKPVLRKTEPPFDNICWMLYCGNGTHAISTAPALQGSKCDSGKYCMSGKCTKKT